MNDAKSTKRAGDWFLTYTGRQFWPLDPKPEDICIRDIAHHLSLICRFNGAVRSFYSVAQHSVMVSNQLPDSLKFIGLMHDATEAYIGDMVRPLKRNMPQYQAVEALVWEAICQRFHLAYPPGYVFMRKNGCGLKAISGVEHVKMEDDRALATERRDLMIDTPRAWTVTEEPHADIIFPWSPSQAEVRFLELFDELKSRRV